MIFSALEKWLRDWQFWNHFGTGWSSRNRQNHGRLRRRSLLLEILEDRVSPAAVPIVGLTAPATPFIGTNIPLAITFTNPSANGATNPGFSPWDYAVLPTTGFQGSFPGSTPATAYDGISFNAGVTPNFLGAAVTFQEINVPASGQVTGPTFAAQGASGAPIVLTGLTPGDQVVFFQLPFGSYAVNQPGGTINFGGTVSNLATVTQPLTITAGGGFSLGNDALNDPSTDPPLVSATTTASVTPSLFTVVKKYLGPEDETATGPNFPEQYEIDVSVAPGQTLTNFQITDALPTSEQWLGAGSTTASANGGIFTGLAGTTVTTTTPGGNLVANLSQIVGTGGPTDAKMTFSFYVPELDAANAQILPLGAGTFENITNTASGTGNWVPLDPRDAAGPVTQTSAPVTITAKSIAVQKTVAVVGGGAVAQGATLQYTIDFEISDYFAFNQLNLADLLPDGVRFDNTFMPTLTVTQHTGDSAAANFQVGNFSVGGVNSDGTQTINFAVSDELSARGEPADGDLLGGDIPDGGTGGALPGNTNPSLFAPGATGQIVFDAVIQQEYSVKTSPTGDKHIKQGDTLTNVVPDRSNPLTPNTGGQVLSFADLGGTGNFQADTSAATVTIATGTLAKNIYAINGSTAVTSPYEVQAGDDLTYQLIYTVPTGTLENLTLTDFLPLPVFDATNGGSTAAFTFDNIASATAPAAYHAQFGPTDQYLTRFETGLGYAPPTISTPTDGTNRAIVAFPTDLQDPQQRTTTIDILFTVPVLDKPFADGLFLTNQADSEEGDTNAAVTTDNSIAQIELTQPNLTVVKSVVASTLSSQTFGAVTFSNTQIGTTNQRWTGTISSNGLTSNPINANLNGPQAGDLVEFAIIVQNTGLGVHGAFDVEINDTLPVGFVIPAGGLNLQVRDGTGTPIGFTNIGTGLFGAGIQLTDPSATEGSLAAFNATSGANIAVITYDLQLEPNSTQADAVHPGEALVNTGSLNNYAAVPGGVDYLATPLTDPATVTVATPVNTKSLVSTSEASTAGNNVAIGEIVRYQLVVQIPQSSSPNFQIVDQLPAGLSYLDDGTTKVGFVSASGSALTSSDATINTLPGLNFIGVSANVTPTAVFPAADISGGTGAGGAFVDGNHPVFSFSTLTDNDNNDANPEFVVLDFNALVDNVAVNTTGHADVNNFIDRISGAQVGPVSNNITVTVVQPAITTVKTVAPNPAQIGDAVTYTITYKNTGGNDAFDSLLTDTLNASLTATSITVAESPGVTNVIDNSNVATNTVDVSVGDIPVGDNVTVTVAATVNAATVGQPIPNTANAVWTSLPGPFGTTVNPTGSSTPGVSGAANGERDGAGGVNSYASSGSANLNIINPAPVKSLVATSEASTTGSNVAIGEIVRYQLAVQIPHAASPGYQLVDQLPAGMSFLNDGTATVAFVSTSGTTLNSSDPTINTLPGLDFAGASSNVTPPAVFPAADISGGTGAGGAFVDGNQPVFSFSNVTNSDLNNANPAFIVLEFNALVDNVAVNTTGHADVNAFIDRVSGAQVGPASNAVDVTVVQPSIANLTKSVQSTGRDPGDTVAYRVTYSNTGTNDAFQSRLTDTLPASLSFNVGSVAVTLGGGAAGITDNSSANTLDVTIGDVPVGGTVQIDYTATILTTDPAGSSIVNTANLTYASLPGPFGTTVNPTGSSTPGAAGSATGERDGAGGVNSYLGSSSLPIVVNSSTLTGFVYQDLNNNAVKDAGEPIISGVTVTLTGNDFLGNPVSATTTTNGSGQYTFPLLLPSDVNGYTITEMQPAAFLNGQETPPLNNFTGTVGVNSNVGSTVQYSDVYSGIVIGRESMLTGANYNFGELPPATVSGSVYVDANDDGVRQAGEIGITGVQVELQGTDDQGNPVTQFTNTNGAGDYSFTGLRPGAYFITEPTQPAGYFDGLENEGNTPAGVIAGSAGGPDRIPGAGAITLAPGATSANNMFGELLPASLAGFVYVDANDDGVKQASEAGIGNVTVTLTGTNDLGTSITQPATTLGDGSYSFTNLRPGTYVITETQPANYIEGIDTIGTPGGNATVQDVFSNVVLNEGVNGVNNNFGERLTADLAINKTDNQTTAIPGTPITYVITITNNGPSTVNTLTMTDAVPATILNPVFSGASSGTFNSATGVWTGLNLAVGQSITIEVSGVVDPAATGILSNTATVGNAQDSGGDPVLDPDPGNNSSTDTDTLMPQATLTITKTDGTPTYTPGTSTTYTIVVINTGPSDVTGAAIADNLPATITSDTWTASYSAGSSGAANGAGDIGTNVNLATGGTATFTLVANIVSTATGNLTNTATVTNPINGVVSSASDTDTPDPIADLAITKTDGQTTAIPGDPITYTIVATNNGPSFVTGATVADNMPAALIGATWSAAYAGAGSSGPAGGAGNIAALVNLAVGGTATFTLTATVASTATGTLSNTVTVAVPPGTTDSDPKNNSATDSDTLTPQADLSITKTDGSATYTPGGTTTYTIVATNAGPSFVTAATVADAMPAAITGDNWTAVFSGIGSAGPASGTGNISSLVNLPVGGTATFTVVANINAAATGNLVNTATVTPPVGTTDPTPGNNSATDTDTPAPVADLQITKTDGSPIYIAGGTTTYTIVATNAGPSFVTGATVADTMPTAITSDTWTALYAGAGSTGPASGSGNISSLVNLAVGGTATFTLVANISPAATGNLVNTATVTPPIGTSDPVPANNSATATNTPAVTISGYVFVDVNDNGVRDPGDPAIPGTVIALSGTNVLGASVSRVTTTDATGFYQFAGLVPGIYTIRETQPAVPGGNPPALYLEGQQQNGTPAAATVATDLFENINLTQAPFVGGDYNFGELLPSSLSGFVYVDPNDNGVRDPNEPGIGGVSVQLTGTDDRGDAVNVSVVTNAAGSFSFQNMRPGTYTITETQPAMFIPGQVDPGTGVATPGAAGNDVIGGIVVSQDQVGVVFRFAELGLLPQYISKRQFLTLPAGALSAGPAGSGVVFVNPIDPPTDTPVAIEDTTLGTAIGDDQAATPFSNVVLDDPGANENYTVAVTLSAAANGTLSNLAGGTYNPVTGVYTSPILSLAEAQATLRGLIFLPAQGQVAPGHTVFTQFTIQVSDGTLTSTDNSTNVIATAVFGISPRTLASYWTVNAAGYNQTLTTTGGLGPVNAFAVTAGTLPAGLTLDPVLGTITGTPTTVGSSTFTITATNTGETATQTYTIVVIPPEFAYNQATQRLTVTATAAFPNFEFTQATTATAAGTSTVYTFTLSDNASPANTVSQTFPDAALSMSLAPTVVVNGVGGEAILVTNDTYATPTGLAETPERITLGALNDAGAGAISKFPGNDVSNTAYTFLILDGFPISYAYAGRADGSVLLHGTAGVAFNGFVTAGNYSYIGGPGLFHLAQGAPSVYGYSAGQPTDFAYHYAANAGSAYVVSGTAYSYMSTMDTVNGVTQPYFNEAVGFLLNTGVSKNPGQDYAYIIDSPGNDTFVGGSAYSYMFIAGTPAPFAEFDAAYGFSLVYAQSFVGGTDSATNNDPARNILFGFRLQ